MSGKPSSPEASVSRILPTGITGTVFTVLTVAGSSGSMPPNATSVSLIGTFNGWKEDGRYRLHHAGEGDWVIRLDEGMISHGDLYKLVVRWKGAAASACPPMSPARCRMMRQRSSPHRYGSRHRAM
ncbi:MAG: hypothetical protein MZV63_24895 [Marinilabiliales bacterium]|nr:hypothetical protein [Marinilabiliales bacterium]